MEIDFIRILIELKHTKGTDNIAADFMSRLNNISRTRNTLRFPLTELTDRYKVVDVKFHFSVVEEEETFLSESNALLIHPGINKYLKTIQGQVSIKELRKKETRVAANCETCNTNKFFVGTANKATEVYDVMEPFQKISMDLKSSIPEKEFKTDCQKGSFYILVVMDIFSRFIKTHFFESIRTKDIISALKLSWLSKYPHPKELLSD